MFNQECSPAIIMKVVPSTGIIASHPGNNEYLLIAKVAMVNRIRPRIENKFLRCVEITFS